MTDQTRPPAGRCGAPASTGLPCRSPLDEGERCTTHGGRGRTPAPDRRLPGEPLCAECWRHATARVDDRPLCWQHAARAERIAAEAAREAKWWAKMFTPTPGEPYRADPEWQAALRVIVADSPDDASDALPDRIRAIFRKQEIEQRWEHA